MTFDEAIRTAARRTAVQVQTEEAAGSGFFARSGVVLTCAHVVGPADTVAVIWDDEEYTGRVLRRFPEEPSTIWPFPDIAVIVLDEPLAHPVPYLSTRPPLEGELLLAYGYADGQLQPGPQQDGVLVTTTAATGGYQRVKDDQVVEGLSGALVVSVQTGLVVGMIKASRGVKEPRGGWLTPATELLAALDETVPEPAGATPFDRDGWTDALLSPIRAVLEGQLETAAGLPYQLMDGPAPALADVYVEQQAAGGTSAVDIATMLAEHRHVLIIGTPGSGKTSLVQRICQRSAQWWLDRTGPPPFGAVLPVRATASSFSNGRPFLDSLVASVQQELGPLLDLPLTANLFERSPLPGVPWLILIDGLDEVIDPKYREMVLLAIRQRVAELEHPHRLVITTRPALARDLDTLGPQLPRYELLLFQRPQMEQFAKSWFTARHEIVGASTADEIERVAARFVEQVDATEATSLAGAPLLLTIAALVFEQSPSYDLPQTITTLYQRFVTMLLDRADAEPAEPHQPTGFAWIRDRCRDLLHATAYRWFFGGGQPILDAATELVVHEREHSTQDTPELRAFLRTMFLQSGLVIVAADEVQWIHLSIAEYLAAQQLATKQAEHWLTLADAEATANVARFALVQAVREQRLPVEFIEQLAMKSSAALSFRELLTTAGLLPAATVALLARRLEAANRLDLIPFAAIPPAAAVLREAAVSAPTAVRRMAAAGGLVEHGSASDAHWGADLLTALVRRPGRPVLRLEAAALLVTTVLRRTDWRAFAADVQQVWKCAADVVQASQRRPSRQIAWLIRWPMALPPTPRRHLLESIVTSDRASVGTRAKAAHVLAKDFADVSEVRVLEDLAQGRTRLRLIARPAKPLPFAVASFYFAALLAVVFWAGLFSWILEGVVLPLGVRDVIGLGGGAITIVSLVLLLRVGVAFRPWWSRPSKSAELAGTLLVDLSLNASVPVRSAAGEVLTRVRHDDKERPPLTFGGWLRKRHVHDRAVGLAEALPSDSTGQVREQLRRMLASPGMRERRMAAAAVYQVASRNPRTARPLVLLLREAPELTPRLRQQMEPLADIVDGDDF